ncbi:hypothetical protein AA12717_0252 [Gluconacetobacter sacchari DSM 12717]|uniref:Uncharacterized protein n=2 Tax=Gluconacetobacter sacchari TaxID=92759 RepID=A0A7W4IAQ7_9PROT|nr:hypothetical protein [Gluconacetobacter sacchari]MBB2159338.1 hypothetical protein [Gluconacetobacter sacchari]GBQ19453.1 hypothetical protein AA12717_0252 [Gluconacetobacter sacchari DSM 12717]
MSYVTESLHEMADADLRAWALAQVGPGSITDRIAEAETLIAWVLGSIDRLSLSLHQGKCLGDVLRQQPGGINSQAQVCDGDGNLPVSFWLSGGNGGVNHAAVMAEGYDVIDEKSGRIVGFQASNPLSYRLEKRVGSFAHTGSSSVTADGESAGELPTPSRTPSVTENDQDGQ